MKAKSYKSAQNSNLSGRIGERRLDTFAEAIIREDATQKAIAARFGCLRLSDSESIGLVDFLNEKAQQMLFGEHPVRMLRLGEGAFLIADQHGYDKGKAYGLLYMGVSQWFTSDLADSLKNLLKAKKIFVDLNDEEAHMKALTFEACVYRSMGDYDQSYLNLRRCVEYFRKLGDILWEATALVSLGMTCGQIGDRKGVLRYNRRIIKIVNTPELRWMVGRAQDGIGTIYFNSGQYRKALESYEESLATGRKSQHAVGEARALNDIGITYQQLGDAGKARKYYHESLRIRKEIGQREAQCTCLLHLGNLVLEADEPERGLEYFSEALSIAIEAGAKPRISQAHENLSQTHELMGDFANALKHHKLFHKITDEVSKEQSNTRAQNLKTRLELDKAERVAEVERLKNAKLNEKNEELKRLLNDLRIAQAQLVQAEKMAFLGKLVAGVAHEMNSPIGASNSSIDISQRCINKITDMLKSCSSLAELSDNDRFEKLLDTLITNNKVVAKANERISKIVRSLRSFSNLDEATFQKADIHAGLDSTITLLEAKLNGKTKIIKRYGKLRRIACYPGDLNQVFLNLLTNSLEAIQKEGEIIVQTSVEEKHICIKISDNGIGIPKEKLKTLFDPAFSDKRNRVKAGMGLFVSLNIIQKHKGKITVISEVNKGTTFTIILPIDLDG